MLNKGSSKIVRTKINETFDEVSQHLKDLILKSNLRVKHSNQTLKSHLMKV